jgi:hypothetical protein
LVSRDPDISLALHFRAFYSSNMRVSFSAYEAMVTAALLLGTAILPAQDAPVSGQPPAEAPRLLRDPVEAASATASVPLPDPTPKPVVLPPAEVLDCVEYILPAEGRSIFVQKIAPPPGYVPPPVNPPPSPPPAVPSEEMLARIRAANANSPAIRWLSFSATVYSQLDGTTGTLVRWTHERKTYRAWSSIDWNHFRGLGRFESFDGRTQYWSMMGIGDAPRWRVKPGSLVPPAFPPGEVTYLIIEGDPANKDALADLEVLHNLYRTDGQRLKLAHVLSLLHLEEEKEPQNRDCWKNLLTNPPYYGEDCASDTKRLAPFQVDRMRKIRFTEALD